jgi:ABC-type glycerol-3-phosphate transport system substrate-binding protein
VDEDTLLVAVSGAFTSGNQELTLSRVLPDQVPETTTLTMAVGISIEGADWTNTNGDLSECVADFNRTNGQYRIEAAPFYDATDLNLMVASGDMPDFFCWGDLSLDSLLESYRKKGYLLDMTDLFESDPDTTLDHFLPQLVEAATSSDGGIYAMPTKIFCDISVGRPDLVGTEPGWSVADFYAAVQAAPEGSWSCTDPALCLKGFMYTILDHFVDRETGTCDFHTEEFETLMELCRDYQTEPSDTSQEDTGFFDDVIAGDTLLQDVGFPGGAACFATYYLPDILENDLTLIGEPGVGGNGLAIFPQQSYSISAISPNQAGAWAFLKKLYGYDYQSEVFHSGDAVRMDAMEAGQQRYLVEFSMDCTQEDLQYALSLIEGGTVVGYQDDTILDIVAEEAEPFMDGSKTFDQVVDVIENRVNIYLSEQS